MLELVKIKKDYEVAGGAVHALKGVSLKFRKSEFVSILGPSGCGKTTLLNIIGGLDHYTSGDLVIDGKSTKEYTDREWDTYRNHSIGFIFQSYHLIPHQTILQNVELALMISGVSKRERRRRAVEALERVGLKDRINNRPNQLSGGQAQRVAIARALINDPEIVLADEPTGALDSKTSVQIMELLKEISRDRLVIMVTHNPELARRYSTRIINVLDGVVTGDSSPYAGEPPAPERKLTKKERREAKKKKGSRKLSAMPFNTAFMLSLKNLMSKGKRTAMVSVAGSIGIIGVSMVLAISSGVQAYINDMQDDMLSGNPVSVTETAIDYTSLMNLSQSAEVDVDITRLKDKVYVNSLMETLGTFAQGFSTTNNIGDMYLSYVEAMPDEYYNVMQYGYGYDVANNIYTDFKVEEGVETVADGTMSVTAIRGMYTEILRQQEEYADFAGTISTVATFDEMPDNYQYILSQYDIVAAYSDGNIITDASELSEEQLQAIFSDKSTLVMVTSNDTISDLMMGQFGYLTQKEFLNYAFYSVDNELYDEEVGLVGSGMDGDGGFDYTKFIGPDSKKFTWYSNDDVYCRTPDALNAMMKDMFSEYIHKPYVEGMLLGGFIEIPSIDTQTATSVDLSVNLILQKKEGVSYGCLSTGFYHTKALTDYARADALNSEIVKFIDQSENGYLDNLYYIVNYINFTDANGDGKIDASDYLLNQSVGYGAIYDSGSIMDMLMAGLGGGAGGGVDPEDNSMLHVESSLLGGAKVPSSLYIYPVDFDSKTLVTEYLDEWNDMCERGDTYSWTDADGTEHSVQLSEGDKITYTDTVGLIISMVNTMIQMITIALIAFTALSLVVSTVMIGIITYVSVVERIKEIGILRAIGARKKDIKRLFNAETFIIGFMAGVVGIIITYLLSLIVNVIVLCLSGIWGIAALPWWQALIMIVLSVLLTLVSGLIPASAAAKKDPVVALRTE